MPNNNEEKHAQPDDAAATDEDSCDDLPCLEYNTFWYNPAPPLDEDDGQQFDGDPSTDDDLCDDDDLSDMPRLVDGTPPLPAILYEPPYRHTRMAVMDLPPPVFRGHTHASIDQIFRLRRRYPGDHPQRFPFLSLQTDNANSEFRSSTSFML